MKPKRKKAAFAQTSPALPYEYKLRRYKARKVRREESKEIDELERFATHTAARKQEESMAHAAPSQNVVLRRHLRKKDLESKIKKAAQEADGTHTPPALHHLELRPVYEPPGSTVYTFDIVEWEDAVENDKIPLKDAEDRLLLDNAYDEIQWEQRVLYDDACPNFLHMPTHLTIDASDKNLLFDITDKGEVCKEKKKEKKKRHTRPLSKYNISGDKHYAEPHETQKSALGIQGVQHSIPALKLAREIYKTYLTKEELRFFHRPPLHIPATTEIRFSALAESTAKASSILKKKKELTLRDTASFVLLEYSEEIPPLIIKTGMASIITTFYRKSTAKDTPPHDAEIGSMTLLEPKDPSPFLFIGDVQPGDALSGIVNNLYKAPIVFHGSSDLLAVRTRGDKGAYYVRCAGRVGCVGQTLPLDEAFSPHSRRHNVFCKNRMKVAAYRLFYEKGNRERKMLIHQLDEMFPHFSEGSKRKWLKEYAECIKKGKENVWVLKPSASLLSEEDLRRAVTPEKVCQYESMLAEERRLKDAGIVLAAGEDEELKGEEEELKLAVWNCTRNFVNAAAGKGVLEISGPGDPTGIGEGFSFVRARRQREAGEEERKTTLEQAQAYRDEIRRIWDAQMAALRCEKVLEDDAIRRDAKKNIANEGKSDKKSGTSETKSDKTQKTANQPANKSGRILSITRTVMSGDKKVQETEIVTDPRVIEAYMKARKKQKKEETRTSLRCGSCGVVGHMKTNKSCMNYKGKAIEKKERKKSPLLVLSEIILGVIKELFAVPFSVAFHRPVSLKKFPNYLSFIPHPIDLTTMKIKARNSEYNTYNEFLNDMQLMNANCNTYNGAGHSLTKISGEMLEIALAAYSKNKDAIAALEGNGHSTSEQ
ncbi:transcription initiation factor TFIID subunit 1 [Nematocida minor]|uniref:transcription initiation factor TFIID subunit 1 n=1 Tax=Nematocida minor TaxID=1912983 RepID=UPI002220BEB1|nr:transcription initiation factor TFIID subunit 1 [Nematocida minor]KAI5191994.1 transcription initiation factor TFIID subunit 1 [Nematocida minor]